MKIKLPTDVYNVVGITGMKKQAEKYAITTEEHIRQECDCILSGVLKNNTPPRLLEVGYGYGRLAKELSQRSEYTGIDIMEQYYKYCSIKYPGVNFLLEDFFEHKVQKGTYDIVVFPWTVLGHYPFDVQSVALRKSSEMINHAGIIAMHWRDFNLLSAEQKNVRETDEGYSLIVSNEILPEMKFFFPKFSFWENHAKLLGMNIVVKDLTKETFSIPYIMFGFEN